MRLSIILGLAALALVTIGLAGSAPQAHAIVQPGPPGILQPAVSGCPVGVEVTGGPGPINLGLFIPPGPATLAGGACAQGIALLIPPGPANTPGMAFGLPLNADDCAGGTAALNDILTALGGTPLSGNLPPPGNDACPDGTAAMDAIIGVLQPPNPNCPQGTIRASGPFRGMRGTLVLMPPGPPDCPPGTALLVQQNAAGTPRGFLALLHPPSPLQLYRITPSGVAGVGIIDPGPPN